MIALLKAIRSIATSLVIFIILLSSQSVYSAETKSNDNDFRVYWKEGLRLDTSDKKFRLKIGGRGMVDWSKIAGDGDEKIETAVEDNLDHGVEIRRARFYFAGLIYRNIEFKVQYDFAGGDATPKDVYMGAIKLPYVGAVRVGHFKEPFGLEELTSSKYITFLERSGPIDAFSPGRNMGFMLHNHVFQDRLTWQAGIFRDVQNGSEDTGFGEKTDGGGLNFTGRVTGLPWYAESNKLWHVGFAYSFKNFNDDQIQYRSRPEIHIAPRFVDTDTLAGAESAHLLGFETAFVYKQFSAQAEWFFSINNAEAYDDPIFNGGYVQLSYFLTKESRNYNKKNGTFGRIKPNKNVFEGGWGAWELALRYSRTDLETAVVDGGEMNNFTFGINWYLNPNTRMMMNYVHSILSDVASANAFATRFQVDF